MKRSIKRGLLVVLALGLSIGMSQGFADYAAAPDFELPSAAGNISLAQYKGKVVYLDFWASWCGPCKQSFPWMNSMQEKYQAQGLQIVAINLDANKDDAASFLAGTPAKFTVAFDAKGVTPRAYGVKGMPTSYLIDRDGKVIMQHMGFNAADREKLELKIQSLLGAPK
ncbi:TlpA family protein disulfide reductase [Methylovorus mays]|uniref:TlpA family protein disulfide reductase n=1 Tax=Methylovorus mays TaxID=184077 RepID=UPI001E4B0E9C|nr:TlpA disulfide reductase family protein [Methylovorus mays]MCB5207815.1 TlpA family protein disulfide reductase [Methylovorus mays]